MPQFTYKGFSININHKGQFVTVMGDLEIEADSLAEAQSSIDKELKGGVKKNLSLPVVGRLVVRGVGSTFSVGTLTGVNRTSRDLQITAPDGKAVTLEDVMADTESNRRLTARRIAAINENDKTKVVVENRLLKVRGWGRISAADYGKLIEEMEKKHEAQTKEEVKEYGITEGPKRRQSKT